MNQRVCRRCLLRELDGEYFQSIYQYIQNLPAEWKVDKETYAARLERCRECPHLINGMCELCGCFVEVRAAKKSSAARTTRRGGNKKIKILSV